MKEELLIIAIFAVVLVVFGGGLAITGFLSGSGSKQVSVTINSSNLIFNSSEIEISGNTVKLKSSVIQTEKETVNVTEYKISKAFFEDASNKTEKLVQIDNLNLTINENKPLYLIFNSEVSNGDIVLLYLVSNKTSTIDICDFDVGCTKKYGSVSSGDAGLYNISLINLENPTKSLLLTSTEKIKIDKAETNKGSLERAIVDPEDRTSRVASKDGDTQNIGKNKLFYVILESKISSGTAILYLSGDKTSKISLCSFPSCSTEYGSFNYIENQAGFYSVNLSTNFETNKIIIDTEKATELDYVNFSLTQIKKEIIEKTVYPLISLAETKEFSFGNLETWSSFLFNKNLNNQTINLFYSTDNSSWSEVSGSGDLSSVDKTSKKIKFRLNFSTNNSSTPEISNLTLNYIVSLPSYGSQSLAPDSKVGELLNITFNSTNPHLIRSVDANIINHLGKNIKNVSLQYNNKEKLFIGQWNTTGLLSGIYIINLTINSDYTETRALKDIVALIEDVKGSFSSTPVKSGEFFKLDSKENTSSEIEIKAENVSTNINIVQYSKNIKQSLPDQREVGKYLEIVTEDSIDGLEFAKIKIYYTEQEISSAGIEESSLAIQYYNDTSSNWEKLNSTVNTTEKYVEVTTTHFSTYGLFGNQISSSPQSSGSGGGTSFVIIDSPTPLPSKIPIQSTYSQPSETPKPTKFLIEKESIIENQNICIYSIDVNLPEEVGLAKSEIVGTIINTGTCDIETFQINITDTLKDFVYLDSISVDDMKSRKTTFKIKLIDDRSTIFVNPVQGLAVASDKKIKQLLNGKLFVRGISNNSGVVDKQVDLTVEVPSTGVNGPLLPALSVLASIGIIIFLKRKRK